MGQRSAYHKSSRSHSAPPAARIHRLSILTLFSSGVRSRSASTADFLSARSRNCSRNKARVGNTIRKSASVSIPVYHAGLEMSKLSEAARDRGEVGAGFSCYM